VSTNTFLSDAVSSAVFTSEQTKPPDHYQISHYESMLGFCY